MGRLGQTHDLAPHLEVRGWGQQPSMDLLARVPYTGAGHILQSNEKPWELQQASVQPHLWLLLHRQLLLWKLVVSSRVMTM